MFARKVMRQMTTSWMPSAATAETLGVSMTLGFTLMRTASRTSRPARSIAAARENVSRIPAFSAEMSANTTRST